MKRKELYERHLYLNKDITNLKSCVIQEYDIRDAGFSIIKFNKLLDKKTISWLSGLDKKSKNVQIGLILRDNIELSTKIMKEFIRIRKVFFESNNLEDKDVLSIKKDAIFTINKPCKNLIVDDYFEFRKKNKYSSYIYLSNIEFYYSAWTGNLDIKGLGKKIIKNNKFIDDIKMIMKINETLPYNRLFQNLLQYRHKYLNYELPIEHYRELNSDNKFILKNNFFENYKVVLDNITEEELKEEIDITYNYIKFVIPLISLLV